MCALTAETALMVCMLWVGAAVVRIQTVNHGQNARKGRFKPWSEAILRIAHAHLVRQIVIRVFNCYRTARHYQTMFVSNALMEPFITAAIWLVTHVLLLVLLILNISPASVQLHQHLCVLHVFVLPSVRPTHS